MVVKVKREITDLVELTWKGMLHSREQNMPMTSRIVYSTGGNSYTLRINSIMRIYN